MIGKVAAVLGPFFVAFAAAAIGNARSAAAAILPLLVVGAAVLMLAPDPDRTSPPSEGHRQRESVHHSRSCGHCPSNLCLWRPVECGG